MAGTILKVLSSVAVLAVVFTPPARAQQDQWSWPEKPKNLQVLPKDWPGSRLSPVKLWRDVFQREEFPTFSVKVYP